MSTYLWYASYGSNLLYGRFLCYISGGVAPGSTHNNPGARDQSLPTDKKPYEIDRQLYFAERSEAWHNLGVAFIEIAPKPQRRALGRIYRITREQFEDVFAQENRAPVGRLADTFPSLERGESRIVSDSWYGRLIHLDDLDGEPVYTFTRRSDAPPSRRLRPSKEYLATIIAGLIETNPTMSGEEIIDYLLPTEAGGLGERTLRRIVSEAGGML